MNSNKRILALDLSLNGTGAIYGTPKLGVVDYKFFSPLQSDIKNEHCIKVDKDSSSTEKLDNLICWYLRQVNKVDFVVMESPSLYGTTSNSEFKNIYGIIEYLNRRLDIETILIPPISLKMYATDNSKAEKIDMVNQSIKEYGDKIYFENISKKHREDIADASHLFTIGVDYLKSYRLPAPKGCLGTQDIKYFETLPLNRQMVIAKLYNRNDLYDEAKKIREKRKKESKKNESTKN